MAESMEVDMGNKINKASKASKIDLEPPDYHQCQTEETVGTFLSLGGQPHLEQCIQAPIVIVREIKPNKKDGRCGSMSMCLRHFLIFVSQEWREPGSYLFEQISTPRDW